MFPQSFMRSLPLLKQGSENKNDKGEKTMKKLFALLLALVLAFSLFACTEDEPDDDGGTPPAFTPGTDGGVETPIIPLPMG